MNDNRRRDERLRHLLQRGDPADDEGQPTGEEWARMKRAMLTASTDVAASPRFGRRLILAATIAGAALIAIRLVWIERQSATPVAPPRQVGREARTLRFVTANGTQIVWTLDPNLEL